MTCCEHCQATEDLFNPKLAKKDLQRYRSKGPGKVTNLMLEGIRQTGIRDGHLLDVGGGIGILHHELIGDLISRVTHIEASPASSEAAREEDQRRGYEAKVEYLNGDAVELASDCAPTELVTLDKVICCYPDWKGLVRTSAAKARKFYGISLPRDRWYIRMVQGIGNLFRWLSGNDFRSFVHPVDRIDDLLQQMGFRRSFHRQTFVWDVILYELAEAN